MRWVYIDHTMQHFGQVQRHSVHLSITRKKPQLPQQLSDSQHPLPLRTADRRRTEHEFAAPVAEQCGAVPAAEKRCSVAADKRRVVRVKKERHAVPVKEESRVVRVAEAEQQHVQPRLPEPLRSRRALLRCSYTDGHSWRCAERVADGMSELFCAKHHSQFQDTDDCPIDSEPDGNGIGDRRLTPNPFPSTGGNHPRHRRITDTTQRRCQENVDDSVSDKHCVRDFEKARSVTGQRHAVQTRLYSLPDTIVSVVCLAS